MQQKINLFNQRLQELKQNKFIKKNHRINRNKYKEHFQFMNDTINYIKTILFKGGSKNLKIKLITQIQDFDNNFIFTKEDAKYILNKLAPQFKKTIRYINSKKNKAKKLKSDSIIHNPFNHKKGGAPKSVQKIKNMFSKPVKNITKSIKNLSSNPIKNLSSNLIKNQPSNLIKNLPPIDKVSNIINNTVDNVSNRVDKVSNTIDAVSNTINNTVENVSNKVDKVSNTIDAVSNTANNIKNITGDITQKTGNLFDNVSNTMSFLSKMKMKKQNANPTIMDIIFFPIWSFEQSPYGDILTVPLDFISVILDMIDPMIELTVNVVGYLGDIITSVVGIIPAAGDVVTIAWSTLADPIEEILADGTDFLGLLINILRKEWKLAIISSIDLFDNLASWSDSFITTFYYLNKWINRMKTWGIFGDNRMFEIIRNVNGDPMNPTMWFLTDKKI